MDLFEFGLESEKIKFESLVNLFALKGKESIKLGNGGENSRDFTLMSSVSLRVPTFLTPLKFLQLKAA